MSIEIPPRKSPEALLLQKHGLRRGSRVSLEKVAISTASPVPVGDVIEGVIQNEVKVGSPLAFESGAAISTVERIEERNEELLIHTSTSTYRLLPESNAQNQKLAFEDIDMVETAKGSSYRYLPDGTTQRFKKVEGKEYPPHAALVYVPNFAWIKQHATPEMLEKIGQNEALYVENLLGYVQNPHKDGSKVYIVDETGKKIETNQEIQATKGCIYLVFLKGETGVPDFTIPVSHTPKLGFMTFDTRIYEDEETGERMRERHLGNEVIRIVRKES